MYRRKGHNRNNPERRGAVTLSFLHQSDDSFDRIPVTIPYRFAIKFI